MCELCPFREDINSWPPRPPERGEEAEVMWHADLPQLRRVAHLLAVGDHEPVRFEHSKRTQALSQWLRLHSAGEAG